jgi:hypothetical protein
MRKTREAWGAAQALSEEALEAKLYAAATAAPAGEKLFVDYSGKRPHYIDRETGERVDVELFTAVLGASNYVYTEATRSQQLPDWIASHVRAFTFLGGVPLAVVPDQLKSAVTTACRYEPEINRTYAEMAVHYDVAVMPARPAKPKDKAKVEGTVLIVQRWVLARLRNQRFFSLIELNGRIAELNDDLNGRVMRKYGYSRRQLFEQVERAALRPLPRRGQRGDTLRPRRGPLAGAGGGHRADRRWARGRPGVAPGAGGRPSGRCARPHTEQRTFARAIDGLQIRSA